MTAEDTARLRRATEIYSGVWHALLFQTQSTFTFRRVADLGIPAAQAQLARDNEAFAREMADGNSFDRFMRDKTGLLQMAGGPDGISRSLTDTQVRSARSAVDAASLVFMHTTLDVAVSDLCEVVALISPESWDSLVGFKQVPLERVRETSYSVLREQAIAASLTALRKDSLRKRVDCLFAFCKPPAKQELVRGFQFDSDRLLSIDRLRQQVVHGRGIANATTISRSDLEFLQQSGLHLLALLNWKFDIRVDPRIAMGVKAEFVREVDDILTRVRDTPV